MEESIFVNYIPSLDFQIVEDVVLALPNADVHVAVVVVWTHYHIVITIVIHHVIPLAVHHVTHLVVLHAEVDLLLDLLLPKERKTSEILRPIFNQELPLQEIYSQSQKSKEFPKIYHSDYLQKGNILQEELVQFHVRA